MKNFAPFLIFLLIVGINSCSKKDDCDNPVDCLPPLTTTGEGTIGCLIDGQVFKPGGSQWGGPTQQANYNTTLEGELYFSLIARNKDLNKSIGLSIINEEIIQGQTYILGSNQFQTNKAQYNFIDSYETNQIHVGEIGFIKFDDVNGIVSGTFWFDAVNENGEVVEIREGRFDMNYN
ncbi:hypothetical protein SAMN05444483_101578 [Salegentibacter echinorum]|uniref:Uncharacterized protein n=1 Tax=Salegentibacter echinorum TaxID=1073325 RepID=A0A1M5CLJ4_SALEC|nr:DUF6252 family protein [Salegentibacter echinorum]SHF55583.1 hypothetical protein SAMN05444483_101578 [Salegentibacter echinorum]